MSFAPPSEEANGFLHFKHYQTALESANIGIIDINFSSQKIRVNHTGQRILGNNSASVFSIEAFLSIIFQEDLIEVSEVLFSKTSPSRKQSIDLTFRISHTNHFQWIQIKGQRFSQPVACFSGIIQNVTEQKNALQTIEEKAFLFDELGNHSAIGIWIANAEPSTTFISEKWVEWTGRPYEDHLGIGWLDCIIDEDREPSKDKFIADFLAQRTHKNEFTIRHTDGTLRSIDCSGTPQFNADGTFKGYLGTVIDITKRVNAQKQLHLRNEQFNDLITQAPFPIGLYTTEAIVIELANEALLKMWSKDESIIGKTLHEALPELHGQPFEAILKQVYQTGIAYETQEQRTDLLDGNVIRPYWFKFTYKPLFNAEGKVWAIIHMAADITSRVLAREQIADAEANLRLAIDTADLATWQYSPVTDKVYASERFQRWFGLKNSVSDLVSFLNSVAPADQSRISYAIQAALLSSATFDEEFTSVDAETGRVRVIHAQARSLADEEGNTYLLTGLAQNITNQRVVKNELERLVKEQTEALRMSNYELQQTNESLKQFAFIASHDLQEPLRKIQSFISLLYNTDVERLTVKGASTLSRIHASANRMSSLINDLLTFSGLTIKDVPMAPLPLKDLINDILEDLDNAIDPNATTITIQSLPVVWGNASQLTQLFQNLLTNAIKFSRPGVMNHITIDCGKVSPEEVSSIEGLNPRRSYNWIDVSDEGIGFDSEYGDRIFQMFQRLHSKDQYEGTGIGLAVCRKVVENHQGIITVSSVLNEGATFRVYLPETPPIRQATALV
ncbi:PAS domain S-box protein [Siphonobacter sp. SORGH_AS_0500]|uniref:PAS domain S-box protein n=2 Tax=unclassified Siphonobacter TaxID=2635712 RepID=UPI0028564BCA|nr:PAS domain S-box protein [Siphonobacter sp. SORGH_AS_0500]MDR6195372.1 PAS domain S-box-containing protein [Siphonobacter sp. SORGH_AS_0500]